MPLLMKLLHVITAFWFVAGLLGRTIAQWEAARVNDIHKVSTFMILAGRFEKLMVIPGSLAVLAFGLITAWVAQWPLLTVNWLSVSTILYLSLIPIIPLIFLPKGKIFEAALEDALKQGKVTPALTAAFFDRTVAAAHIYELAVIVIVIILMVAKPF